MKNSELQDLFVEYYPALKSFAVRYVGAAEVAEDLVQDVFLRLWEKTNPLQGVRDVSAYLYQMVRFRAIDYLRSEKTKEQTVRKYIAGLAEEEEEAYLEEEVYRRMIKAVEELSPAMHKVLSLSLEGLRTKEIAERLSVSAETVKKQKQIARRILRDKLLEILLLVVH